MSTLVERNRLRVRHAVSHPVVRRALGWWRWAPVLLGVAYLVLQLAQIGQIVGTTYLDADTASGPVIAQLFSSAGPTANIVLGTFGWYSTLIFDLATKWLPLHREIWEGAPYLMVLAAAALTGWSAWRVAGRWAGAISAVLIVCAAPHTLHLLLSTTEHGPDWFCLALLGAYLVWLEGPQRPLRPVALVVGTLIVGVIVGVNAASDDLVAVAVLVPFAVSVLGCLAWRRSRETWTAAVAAAALFAVVVISWIVTRSAMSSAHVAPQPGINNTLLAIGDQASNNIKLWWQSIAVLGNGDFFGRQLSFGSGLAVLCAALAIGAVLLIPRLGWLDVRLAAQAPARQTTARLAFLVFWCSSAIFLTGAFIVSATPVDIEADRYLVGVIYAAAAVVPVAAMARPVTERLLVAGACVFALAGVVSMLNGTQTSNAGVALTDGQVNAVIRVAERNHLTVGYAGYWEAAPITWASRTRVQVYPVQACGSGLCPFVLHYISSWYQPRQGIRSFVLTDTALPFVQAPPANLGPAAAVYRLGPITMYVYPYDVASRIT